MKRTRTVVLVVAFMLTATALSAQGLPPGEEKLAPLAATPIDPAASGRIRSDTIRFRRILTGDTTSSRLGQLLYDAFAAKRDPESERAMMKQQNDYYNRYEGRTIREINLVRGNVFDGDSLDWTRRTVNKLHVITRENQIRQDLLFEPGDSVDADQMMNNRRLIRSRDYISDVNIILLPDKVDSMVVDVYVITRDSWTISANADFRSTGESQVSIYDKNILGTGNKLNLSVAFDRKHHFHFGGLGVEYYMPNLFGSFFNGRLVAGKDFLRSEYGLEIGKEFLRRTDFAAGLSLIRKGEDIRVRELDTTYKSIRATADLWGGISRQIKGHRSSLYLTGRFCYLDHLERPDVSAEQNPYFHNKNMALAEFGFYRERFRAANRLYGYGFNEYVAHGFRAGINAGFSWSEFGDRWHMGLGGSGGWFTRIGYIGGSVNLGSYLNQHDGKFYRTALVTEINYFTNLKGAGLYPVRQFVTLGVTRGWNRLEGYHEWVGFTDEPPMHAMRHPAYGRNRLVLNTETVVFTPWHIAGFRIAAFGFIDMALIGDKQMMFDNRFYSTLGLGVRIKNEYMIFNTISIRLGVALGRGGVVNSQYFKLSNTELLNMRRFTPQKPQTVHYR